MAAIEVRYHYLVELLQAAMPADAGPFDRAAWYALLGKEQAPLIATARAGDSGPAAALALTRTNGRLEPLRNWYSFIWRPLVAAGTQDGTAAALLAAIARDLRRRSHRVTLWPVPDEDGSATRLAAAFRASGWTVFREPCDTNHILPVGGRSFAEYWAARPGAMRTTLKRKKGRVAVTIHTRFDAAAWAEYEAIYADSWKPEEARPGLLRRFAQAEGEAGRLRLAIAHVPARTGGEAGRAVAAQFWTVENGTAYIHKLAHRHADRALSAGTTLTAALFEQVIDRDAVTLIDFGTGDDPYKADWMEQARPRYRLDCLDPRRPRAWPPLAKRALASLARRRADG